MIENDDRSDDKETSSTLYLICDDDNDDNISNLIRPKKKNMDHPLDIT